MGVIKKHRKSITEWAVVIAITACAVVGMSATYSGHFAERPEAATKG